MPSPDDLRIGNFSQSVVPSGAPASPTEASLRDVENRLEVDIQKDEAVVKPMKSYEEKLREAGVTKDEAGVIIDAILLKGHYSKEYAITKRVKVRVRTRAARDTKRAQDMLEGMRHTYTHHYGEMLNRYLLAASLEAFGNDKFEHPDRSASSEVIEKAYESRLQYVEKMADPAMRLAFAKLTAFDAMISVVLEEGTVENF